MYKLPSSCSVPLIVAVPEFKCMLKSSAERVNPFTTMRPFGELSPIRGIPVFTLRVVAGRITVPVHESEKRGIVVVDGFPAVGKA